MTDDDLISYAREHRKWLAFTILKTIAGGLLISAVLLAFGKTIFFDNLIAAGCPVLAYGGAAMQIAIMAGAWGFGLLNLLRLIRD